MIDIDIEKAFNNRWRMKGYILENINGKAAKEIARDFFEAGIAIAEGLSSDVKVTVQTPLDRKAEEFSRQLSTPEYIQKYGQQMLLDFYEYWTEPNKSKTKMRFELQPTFDINRRLARWARNNYNRYDRQQPTSDQRSKLGEILAP